jgi:hypothetical protein
MTEKLGGITLLTVSLIIVMMIGSDITYDVGLLKVLIFTMGILGFSGGVYALLRS